MKKIIILLIVLLTTVSAYAQSQTEIPIEEKIAVIKSNWKSIFLSSEKTLYSGDGFKYMHNILFGTPIIKSSLTLNWDILPDNISSVDNLDAIINNLKYLKNDFEFYIKYTAWTSYNVNNKSGCAIIYTFDKSMKQDIVLHIEEKCIENNKPKKQKEIYNAPFLSIEEFLIGLIMK